MKPEEFRYLTDPETLRTQAHLSLLGKSVWFHRHFPERWLGRTTLSKILRKAGLNKKRITVRNLPQRYTMRLEEFDDATLRLDDMIQKIKEEKGHLVFADESVFAARGFQMSAWALPGQNIQV